MIIKGTLLTNADPERMEIGPKECLWWTKICTRISLAELWEGESAGDSQWPRSLALLVMMMMMMNMDPTS